MADQTTPTQSQQGIALTGEIHVIPDEYYGAALKVKQKPAVHKEEGQGGKSHTVLIGVIIFLFVLAGGGGTFVYLNKDSLFPKQPTAPVVIPPAATTTAEAPPPPPPVPSSPSNLAATSTSPQSVSLNWTDTASNESAYRLERRTADRTIYERITDLPPNSTNFQDNSVQASSTYFYRVIARNDTGESEPSTEVAVVTRALPPPPPKQEPLPPAGLDSDSDGISDLEEAIFSSESKNPDSDGDGFLDGNEVFNLYNPMGRAPAKLVGSDIVKTVDGPIGWSMSIPKAWNFTLDSQDGSKATIDSGHGEKFVLNIERNETGGSVVDWYLAKHPGTDKSQLMVFKSKGGYEGIIGPDLLTTYILWGDRVFIYEYDMVKQPFINYRTVYSMMLNSLELKGLPQEIVPAGTGQLPFEPAATQPGTITQPISVTSATPTEATANENPTP